MADLFTTERRAGSKPRRSGAETPSFLGYGLEPGSHVAVGDVFYVLARGDGRLWLPGRIIVDSIEAESDGSITIRAEAGTHTDWDIHRELQAELLQRLEFLDAGGRPHPLAFVAHGGAQFNHKLLAGLVRELTPESAEALDSLVGPR